MNSLSKAGIGMALALSAAISAPAGAAVVVYDQAPSGSACNTSCWTSSYGLNDSFGYIAFDNFTLAADALITEIGWNGFYLDFWTPGNNPVLPTTTLWYLYIFADVGGQPDPGGPVWIEAFDPFLVPTRLVSMSDFGGTPVYYLRFNATLPTPVALAGGTQYWFAPFSLTGNFNPFFSWSPAATDVDGITLQLGTGSNTFLTRPNDRAFTLYSAAVPEPASWALMIAGFGMVGGALRRRAAAGAAA